MSKYIDGIKTFLILRDIDLNNLKNDDKIYNIYRIIHDLDSFNIPFEPTNEENIILKFKLQEHSYCLTDRGTFYHCIKDYPVKSYTRTIGGIRTVVAMHERMRNNGNAS